MHGSVPNLSRYLEPSQSQLPFSLPPEYSQLQRSFWVLAQKGGMEQGGLSLHGGGWGGPTAGFGVLTASRVPPAVHGSLSSVVAALVAERARLEEMRQALDRQGPAPRPGSTGTAGVREHGGAPWGAAEGCWATPAPVRAAEGGLGSASPSFPQPALRRFHSLSVSSDTTLDSFASLHPDEVRGVGWGAPGGAVAPRGGG